MKSIRCHRADIIWSGTSYCSNISRHHDHYVQLRRTRRTLINKIVVVLCERNYSENKIKQNWKTAVLCSFVLRCSVGVRWDTFGRHLENSSSPISEMIFATAIQEHELKFVLLIIRDRVYENSRSGIMNFPTCSQGGTRATISWISTRWSETKNAPPLSTLLYLLLCLACVQRQK